jgi:hypothetical protein
MFARCYVTGRALLAVTVCAVVAGCASAQPSVTPAAIQSAATSAGQWIAPEVKGRNLLYVSEGEIVRVYTYPGGKYVGLLGTGAEFMCSDQYGYVYMPTGLGGFVVVYAHGATSPTAMLADVYIPYACSVDPNTRDVAVTGDFDNVVMIFPYHRKRGWRFGKPHPNPAMMLASFCAYDNKGNLYVDGTDLSGNFMLAELPKASSTYQTISVNQAFQTPGGMQWDGKYLVIADRGSDSKSLPTIYRFAVSGTSATEVSSTELNQSYAYAQFWIQGSKIIGNVSYDSVRAIGYWHLPAGGSPFKTFSGEAPFGVTVSVK